VLNRIRRPGDIESLIEKWNNGLQLRKASPINLGFLRVWFSKAYIYIPKEQRVQGKKIEPRVWIGYLVRYEGNNSYVYRIYDPSKRQVVLRRDVVFWEEPLPIRYLPKLEDPIPINQQKPYKPRERYPLTISRKKDKIPIEHKYVDPITLIPNREQNTFHQNQSSITLIPIEPSQLNTPIHQRAITLPLQTTTRPIALPKARIQYLQPSLPTSETQIDPSLPIQLSSRESSFSGNQNISNISFLPYQQTRPAILLALLPLIEQLRPHTVRRLPPNTPAKRLFSEVIRKQDPDLLIPSIESSTTLIALGRFPRSSSLPIESLILHSVQSPINRSIRETSSVNPIAIVSTQPT
jgi:hypothetical protein